MSQKRTRAVTLLMVSLGLAVVTILVYGRIVWNRHQFVHYDDQVYIYDNPVIMSGLSWANIVWAFDPAHPVCGNYHPLTVITHMLDCQLFGVERPWAHHMVSVGLHVTNVVLLFFVLFRMTGDVWPSALVAALFSWHPLHVESVAWMSERKDVLSTFFWLLAMWFYGGYVRGSYLSYFGVCASLAAGLLSKPMVVTLPCVLLLLDYWPLGRISSTDFRGKAWWRRAGWLVLEKAPLFLLVGIAAGLTLHTQTKAMMPTQLISPLARVINAIHSYNMYLAKTVWPSGLEIPYPLSTRPLTFETGAVGGLGFCLVTYLAISWGRRFPYLPVGWLWYVGTLVPTIGLIQVGTQSMADRYTYVPLIGIFIAAAWGLRDLVRGRNFWPEVAIVATVATLAVLAVVATIQVGHWHDTVSLFSHSLSINPRNVSASYGLATGLVAQGDVDKALQGINLALKVQPTSGLAWQCKAHILLRMQRWAECEKALEQALKYNDQKPTILTEVGRIYIDLGRYDRAEQALLASYQLEPQAFLNLVALGIVAKDTGRLPLAMRYFNEARQVVPNDPGLVMMIARLTATARDDAYRKPDDALRLAEWACAQVPSAGPYWLDSLGAAYAAQGRFEEAIHAANRGRELAQLLNRSHMVKLIARHTEMYQRGEPLREDPEEIPAKEMFGDNSGQQRFTL
jgi:tetratricopeptide (TPR) repeat protein